MDGDGDYLTADLRFPGRCLTRIRRHYNYFRDYDPYTEGIRSQIRSVLLEA